MYILYSHNVGSLLALISQWRVGGTPKFTAVNICANYALKCAYTEQKSYIQNFCVFNPKYFSVFKII